MWWVGRSYRASATPYGTGTPVARRRTVPYGAWPRAFCRYHVFLLRSSVRRTGNIYGHSNFSDAQFVTMRYQTPAKTALLSIGDAAQYMVWRAPSMCRYSAKTRLASKWSSRQRFAARCAPGRRKKPAIFWFLICIVIRMCLPIVCRRTLARSDRPLSGNSARPRTSSLKSVLVLHELAALVYEGHSCSWCAPR